MRARQRGCNKVYAGVKGKVTRADFKMAAVQDQNSALPSLKNLTSENFGKLSSQQHKVEFVS